VDARHLLTVLAEWWPQGAPRLVLHVRHRALLLDLLIHAPAGSPWLTYPDLHVGDTLLVSHAVQARQRGLHILWPAGHVPALQPGPHPDVDGSSPFAYVVHNAADLMSLPAGQLLQEPLNLHEAGQALDAMGAWAVSGWPDDDALLQHPGAARSADDAAVRHALAAISADAALERIEEALNADATLCWLYLQEANAHGGRERGTIDTVARGLQLCGLGHAERWLRSLGDQRDATADFSPLRHRQVLQARLVTQLLNPGDEEDLRREVYLCGLFARLDRMQGAPLVELLQSVPLSQRIVLSLLTEEGPYRPALALAQAMDGRDPRRVQALCESYGYASLDVNRALLRALASWRL
jgi:c-di-GMP phosphodiesterase